MTDWSVQRARDTYNVRHWGNGYFDVNEAGHLVVRPDPAGAAAVDLYALTARFAEHGLRLPVLVRFSGILQHRVRTLCAAFDAVMAASSYRGRYTAVYPIKVNQQASVVDALLAAGGERLGLEAGSKPELLACLARMREGGIVVCNGYKDREYIRLALIGKQLGLRVYIVIEKLSELERVLAEARALGVAPLLGVRVRLASIGAGKWQNTGGEKSKFGLQAVEVLRLIERLRAAGTLGSLQMLHFHMGSQIANVRHIQAGMREAARYYAALRASGADIRIVNVGGGLGVDYEGTRSRSFCSMNYTLEEYAHNIVRALVEICAERHLPHPDIVSESGRALTAHHAVLITNVIETEQPPGPDDVPPPAPEEPAVLRDLYRTLGELARRPPLEAHHDAEYLLAEARALFEHGMLSLAQRARAEALYYALAWRVRERLDPATRAHRELLDELNEKLADKYFCNFSLFQSLPDHWAIEQIFPVVPLHRLDEAPARRGVLEDITCDSDGRVDLYVSDEAVHSTLPLHPLREAEPYLLGIFLVGAYQEILGDMHNLFGDTDSVHVELDDDGEPRLVHALGGDSVDKVLRSVHFDPEELLAAYRSKTAAATWLTADQRMAYLGELAAGLEGYTYLED